MENSGKDRFVIRRILSGILLGIVSVNAIAGGYYAMSGAEGVPVSWLEGSPFSTYTVPGIILLAVVGGSATTATVAGFARLRFARLAAVGAWMILLIWIAVQVSIIGYVSWLQPAMALAGLAIVALALPLPKGAGWR